MELDCPRCLVGKLEEIEVDGILIDRCVVCAGLWFDAGELTQMIGEEPSVREVEAAVSDDEVDLVCPRCSHTRLRAQNLCRLCDHPVDIFRCPSCLGSWIDRGVLRTSEDKSIAQNTRQCFLSLFAK